MILPMTCPPEDGGGPHGYALFLEIIDDHRHEQHEDMVRWIGGVFDSKGPGGTDPDDV
ncbi:MAG: IS1096 element passenger TnpR family protein [Steroidobacteraceae bacterium]